MSKKFEKPFYEFVRFGNNDIVTSSVSCCDVGGIVISESDDEVCPSGDAKCTCYPDEAVNCVNP